MTQKESFLRCNLDFSSVFKDKNYLVTGATSGIGKQVAIDLLCSGANVVLAGRNESKFSDFAFDKDVFSGSSHLLCFDFTSAEKTHAWVKDLSKSFGPFDGCFHAAGVELIKPSRMLRDSDLDAVLSPSLYAALGLASGFASKNIANQSASLVFMSSVAAFAGQSGMSLYSASKAAISGLVKSLACELATKKIRINSLVAGAVETEMHARLTHNASSDVIDAYRDMHLLGFGEKSDISNAALFLLSEYSKWITGTDLVVDGGYLCK